MNVEGMMELDKSFCNSIGLGKDHQCVKPLNDMFMGNFKRRDQPISN